MIRVGILGSGFIVPVFIEAVKLVKDYEVVAISSRNETRLKELKEKYEINYYSLDSEVLFNDPNIDAIYVALPNSLHYEYAKRALIHNKHIIMEKPFCVTLDETKEIINLAQSKDLIAFDAVTLLHLPNYFKMKELLSALGDIKIVNLNFSQYSSRYDKFKNGIILPVFNSKLAGGALLDLGIYNINFVVGLFGSPLDVSYYPNMKEGVDTSGILILDYDSFKAVCVCAKDSKSEMLTLIQGDKARIKSDYASSSLNDFKLINNDGSFENYALDEHLEVTHYYEYQEFKRLFNELDLKKAREYNRLTIKTIEVMEKALKFADIKF